MTEGTGRAENLKQIGESAVNTVLDRVGRGMGKVQERRPLAYDLLESEDAYLVVFDAPGATNSDIQVQFREGAVEVKIDRFREFHDEFEMRFPGRGLSLDGRAELPEDAAVDATSASATLAENGTLSVQIPKTEEDQSVEIVDEESEETDEETADDTAEDAETEDAPETEMDAEDAEQIEVDDGDADSGEEADGGAETADGDSESDESDA
jgi:HSP20 family molecular chaperone IbpA